MVVQNLQVKGTPLIKFQNADRIEQFKQGKIWMNSLKVFREMAQKSPEIGDDYEAVFHINEAVAHITPIDGGSTTMAPINNELMKTAHMNDFVFCMFGINPNVNNFTFSEEQKEKMLEFGDTALIITDSDEFYKRIQSALKVKGIPLERAFCGFVKYYDESVDSVNVIVDLMRGMHNVAFQKRKDYAYQQEFRILVFNDDVAKRNIELDIGDISDISEVVSSKVALNGTLWKSKNVQEDNQNG